MGTLETLVSFSSQVSENIGTAFREISNFIKQIELVGMNIYFGIVIVLFFLIIAAFIFLPIKIYPYIKEMKKLFYRFFEKK